MTAASGVQEALENGFPVADEQIDELPREQASGSWVLGPLHMPLGALVWSAELDAVPYLDGGGEPEDEETHETAELSDDDLESTGVHAVPPPERLPPEPPPRSAPTQRMTQTAGVKPPPLPPAPRATGALAPMSADGPARLTTGAPPAVPTRPQPRQGDSAPAVFVPRPTPLPQKRRDDDEVASLMADLLASERGESQVAGRLSDASWFAEIFDAEFPRLLPSTSASRGVREARFARDCLGLAPGSAVLDLACGWGRHAVELASLGLDVTALDLSRPLLEMGLGEASRRGVPVRFVHGDMREMAFDAAFDGVVCLGTSFGYFDDYQNFEVLGAMARALRPGGSLLIEVVNRDHLVERTPRRLWWEAGDVIVMEEVDVDHRSSRLNVVRNVVVPGQEPWEQRIGIRLYSVHELIGLLGMVGLRVSEVSGDIAHRGAYLGSCNRHIWMVAQRPR